MEEAGGRCTPYDRCQAALQFHHRDPGEKLFAISHQGLNTKPCEGPKEAASPAVCANRHAELEGGYRELAFAPGVLLARGIPGEPLRDHV